MGKKKKNGSHMSGDPHKRAALLALKNQRNEIKTLKLKEFINMDNPLDVEALYEVARELKADELSDEFLNWHMSTYDSDFESSANSSLYALSFFDALLDLAKENDVTHELNIDRVVEYLIDSDRDNEMSLTHWTNSAVTFLLPQLREFLKSHGYLENLTRLYDLDKCIAAALEQEYSFMGYEKVQFSISETSADRG
ncbi:hypothetical protein [Klebsiella aerogenes]|uniref:hypothetical protein n=1 Tax=Klebsiella aerogenes TaxID=548 RepID=UPI0006995FAF|nr:hypothetical protein [Klebsiella aerogenes]